MILPISVSKMYEATANLRFSDVVILVITTSFITYRIFKRFEPDKFIPVGILLILIPSLLVPVVHIHLSNHSLPLATITTFTSYYTLILLYVAIYRLSPFHPLAKYPGPIVNKLSKFVMSYRVTTGRQHLYIRELHRIYGDIVRTGPNELSVNRADCIEPVLGANGLIKGPWWYNRVSTAPALIEQRDPILHKARRKTWDRGLSTASVKNYDEIVLKKGRELVEQFEIRVGKEIDLAMWMGYFAYDFMGAMAFGTDFDMMRTGHDDKGVWKTLEKGLRVTAMMAHISWVFTYIRLIPALTKARLRYLAIGTEYVNRRIKEASKVKDLYYHLTDEEGLEPVKPTMPVIFSDGLLAVIAGSDTTATTFSALFYYLLRDPQKFDRLRDEVDKYFPREEGEPLRFTKMVNMPYLNACINEALRLMPPLPSGSQRCTTAESGGKMVGPYFIPEGNQIFNHLYTLQRNPLHFSPHPDAFIPERWLPSSERTNAFPSTTNDDFILNHAAFIPFSYGPANCAGKNLALLELRVITCFIVQKFELKSTGFAFDSWEERVQDYFVVTRPPLPVVMEMRK